MVRLVRSATFTLACTLVACHRGVTPSPEPEPGSTPIAEAEGGGAELAIVVVPQSPASETLEWLFEPGGRRLASTELGDCSIWDIETGRLIRSLELGEPPPKECSEWLPAASLHDFVRNVTSADGKLEFELGAAVEIVDARTGKQLRDLACPTCASADAITWSASGHQLAFAWAEPLRLEIWDADTGTRLRSELIAGKGKLEELVLAWTQAGLLVALNEIDEELECDQMNDECEWDENGDPLPHDVPVRRALIATEKPGLVEIDLGRDQGYLGELELDPEGHWIYWTHSWEERRSGTSSWLYVVGLGDRTSALGWEHYEDYDDYEGSMSREGQWRSDGATHWAVAIYHDDYEAGFTGMSWETTLTSPPLGRRSGDVTTDEAGGDAEAQAELFGFAGDAIRLSGELCENNECETLGPELPRDCTMLDIGSNHGAELIDCGGRVQLRNAAGTLPLPLDAGSTIWWWTRAGALVLDDGATFMVLDATSGRIGLQRDDVMGELDGKLGAELERMVLIAEEGMEVLDLTSLKVLRVADADPVEAAFSPAGDRLALLEAAGIRVLELPGGKPLASWPVEGVDQLAFRQDGKVIYVGTGMPLRGFDAASGEPLADPVLFAAIAEAIEQGGEIDPSWRWIMHDEFGELLRTIDGRTIEWLEDGAWLPDTGQYTGTAPGLEQAFRIGDDPWAVPEFDAAELGDWLERPDLVEAFLTGQAIPEPTISVGELAGLRAKVSGGKP